MLKSWVIGISAFLLALPAVSFGQDEVMLNPALIPPTAKAVQAFVPKGWLIEEQLAGDLNADGLPDLALALIQVKPKVKEFEFYSRSRALVILFKSKDGQWQRAAVATRLLQCTGCGGAFYGVVEAPAKVKIEKGILIVKQDYGSRNLTDELFRFRYEAASKQFVLIGYDKYDHDRLTGENITESTNFLTGQKIIDHSQYDEKHDTQIKRTSKSLTVAKKRLTIEQVNRDLEL